MRFSKLQLFIGVLIVAFGLVAVFCFFPNTTSTNSTPPKAKQSNNDYMANMYKKIDSTAKNHNVVVVTYSTKDSYSNLFKNMVKSTALKYPDTRVMYVKNNDGSFANYYAETQQVSRDFLGELPDTNIFILEKGNSTEQLLSSHSLDQSQIDEGGYSQTATPGRQPIDSNGLLSGDLDKNNIYLLKHIDTDPEAKQLIQTGIIDFSFNYLHHDN